MKLSILFSFLLIISICSNSSWGKPTTSSPLDSLQTVLPQEILISPKLSPKENIRSIFAELLVYAEDHAPLPESKNLMSTWTYKNDQLLIQMLNQNQLFFISEGELEIESYFHSRIKKLHNDNPIELWTYFTEISTLFPNNLFWLPYYENQISRENLEWSNFENKNWIKTILIPTLARNKSTATKWNKELIINILNLLETEKNTLLQAKSEQEANQELKSFLILLSSFNNIIQMTDSRLTQVTLNETVSLQYQYYDFLQKWLIEIERNPLILNSLINTTPSTTPTIESLTMHAYVFLFLQKKLILNSKQTDRIKSFVNLYPNSLSYASNTHYQGSDREKLAIALNSSFYLRTLLTLKSHIISTSDSLFFSKGQWITKNQFQISSEFQWYEDLVNSLDEILQLTQLNIYKYTLVENCFLENLESPTCQNWREKFPLKLKEEVGEDGQKIKIWEVISKAPIFIPPGQITLGSSERLRIIAPEINFSFFTRIFVPSGVVEIQTSKMISPWIDVSGQSGFNGFSSQTFPGQKPWIKKATVCTTKDYLEGVTLRANPRKNGKINWIGFSIKNPYPSSISVCSSDAQLDNRDEVGDVTKMLDLGLPPENVAEILPVHGELGGKISVELNPSTDKYPLFIPLFIANGGDGSNGKSGQDSPLCQKGKYQSFKVVLSHHKQWFQNWMNTTNYSTLSLTSKGEYGDHWYGLFEINLPRTSGSSGGNAGAGGEIELTYSDGSRLDNKPNRWFLSSGIAGLGGKAGSCGPNNVFDGKEGSSSSQGKLNISKKKMALN